MAASDNVSPVVAADTPEGKILSVGTRSAGLPTGGTLQELITTAYDLTAYPIYRRSLVFDQVAVLRPTNLSHNGAVIQLNLVNDLDDDPTTAVLDEDYDVLPTPLTSWKHSVTLFEYGRVVTKTALIRATSMTPLDPIAAERVGRNMAATMDRLLYNTLVASGGISNSGGAGGAVAAVTVSGKPSATLRAASQSFKENNVAPYPDGYYRAFMTPANETALRNEADAAGWRYWQVNQDPGGGSGDIARGEVGVYEGFRIFTSTLVSAGLGSVFTGNEAMVKAYSMAPGFGSDPAVVVAPVVDRLQRFASIGWYFLGGFARFRSEAVLSGDLAG